METLLFITIFLSMCSARWCICHYKIGANIFLFFFWGGWGGAYSHSGHHPSGPLCPTHPHGSTLQQIKALCRRCVSVICSYPRVPSVCLSVGFCFSVCCCGSNDHFPNKESLTKVSIAISSTSWPTVYFNLTSCREIVWIIIGVKYFFRFASFVHLNKMFIMFDVEMLYANCREKVFFLNEFILFYT